MNSGAFFFRMRSSSLHEIKKELTELPSQRLEELCIALAKYKKDNKEFLDYLLFQSHDKNAFVKEIKQEVDLQFVELKSQTNLYYAKKNLRKILRMITKYCKYLGDKSLAAELYIYFCLKMKSSGLPFRRSQLLVNMYEQQIKKINSLVHTLHEDLQGDYAADLEEIAQY